MARTQHHFCSIIAKNAKHETDYGTMSEKSKLRDILQNNFRSFKVMKTKEGRIIADKTHDKKICHMAWTGYFCCKEHYLDSW